MNRPTNPLRSDEIGKMSDGELLDELKAISEYIDLITEELEIRAMQSAG